MSIVLVVICTALCKGFYVQDTVYCTEFYWPIVNILVSNN